MFQTEVDVIREGDHQVVTLTLNKPMPTSFAQDSVGKLWMNNEDGSTINASHVAIPTDRTWWHGTNIEFIGAILRDSLQTGPQWDVPGSL